MSLHRSSLADDKKGKVQRNLALMVNTGILPESGYLSLNEWPGENEGSAPPENNVVVHLPVRTIYRILTNVYTILTNYTYLNLRLSIQIAN